MLLTFVLLSATSALMWVGLLLLPWRPWGREPALDAVSSAGDTDLSDVTALIPARNEAERIAVTLRGVALQGRGVRTVLVDDQSTDGTADRARESATAGLTVVTGEPLPAGWTGKLWALEQGRRRIETELTLLLDADIDLQPGILEALREKRQREGIPFISLMAVPHMKSAWERMLMPAFVYFFKLIYPFNVSNSASPLVAAAAGGCILVETRVLDEIGGFAVLKDALIDDCTLARRVKSAGHRTWIGSTHDARSARPYAGLGEIWDMVARTAFTQLRTSASWLAACTLAMVVAFWAPLAGLAHHATAVRAPAALALAAMMGSYLPVLRYYRRSPLWALALPLIGTLYLAMTWSSALRYWRGERARWRNRVYAPAKETG